MTPDTQARAGYRRPQVREATGETAARTEGFTAAAARTGQWGAVAHPPPAAPVSRGPAPREDHPPHPSRVSGRAARRAREDASIVKVIPLLAVIVVTAAGVYIAWVKGSAGGGEGGVVGGAGLLAAALARLLLPTQLVGLLATRKRALDVLTLAAFGACLLVAGLVLPR
jgi:Protein of unknown function (DUF3017)